MIKFGTAGMRGLFKDGLDNINTETMSIMAAAYGIKAGPGSKVAVSRDTRDSGVDLVNAVVETLLNLNIEVHLIEPYTTIGIFSNYVKDFNFYGGIYISASHNPAEYNGCKVLDCNGFQINERTAQEIEDLMKAINISGYGAMPRGELVIISNKFVNKRYCRIMREYGFENKANNTPIYYNDGNGAGFECINSLINQIYPINDIDNHSINAATNTATINPENEEAFTLVDNYKDKIIIANDPDCDRVGISEYGYIINGHDLTALFLDYLINTSKDIDNKVLYKSRVTSLLSETIAKRHGIKIMNTPVGFKHIAKNSDYSNFLMGAEESLGYLFGNYTHEKCAIASTVMLSKMINYWQCKGLKLKDRLEQLRDEYLNVIEYTEPIIGKGKDDIEKEMKEQGFIFVGQFNGAVKLIRNNTAKEICYIRNSGTELKKSKLYHKEIISSDI